MNISERAHVFLSRTQVCVLATTGPGNSPHAVPMWYRYWDGIITISTWQESQKCRNVERTGKAMVVVGRREPPYHAVDAIDRDREQVLDQLTREAQAQGMGYGPR